MAAWTRVFYVADQMYNILYCPPQDYIPNVCMRIPSQKDVPVQLFPVSAVLLELWFCGKFYFLFHNYLVFKWPYHDWFIMKGSMGIAVRVKVLKHGSYKLEVWVKKVLLSLIRWLEDGLNAKFRFKPIMKCSFLAFVQMHLNTLIPQIFPFWSAVLHLRG